MTNLTSNLSNPPAISRSPSVQTDVTASRAIGTTYQNTTAKPIFVTVLVNSLAASLNSLVFYCESVTPPTVIVGGYQYDGTVNDAAGSVSFWVLPGYYYKATQIIGTNTIQYWIEWT